MASRRTASKHMASKSTARRSTASKRTRSAVAAHHASSGRSVRAKSAAAASRGGHIRLIQKGCIEFEPQWTAIRVGQSLTWHSRLKRRVTIHVTPGAFGRTAFVVGPGGTVSTGPARGVGAFSMWTKPAACQGTPRGVQGAGPGVAIVRRGG
jgi:plastocyanin